MDLQQALSALRWQDVLDILFVGLIVYNLLLVIRGTRAVQAILGILVLVVLAFASSWLELRTLQVSLENLVAFIPFAVIVLFQSQIRRGLANFGRNPLFRLASEEEVESGFQEVVVAATTLAKRRIGALIVVERLEGLRDYIENGIVLDAEVSFDLLVTIFHPNTPLHDGAVILHNDRVAAAACFLPLSSSPELGSQLGTRHRAAVGISEETDAIAIVVSEERGEISVAMGGELTTGLDGRQLRSILYRSLVSDVGSVQPRRTSEETAGAQA